LPDEQAHQNQRPDIPSDLTPENAQIFREWLDDAPNRSFAGMTKADKDEEIDRKLAELRGKQ